jgi:alpha-glucosidase (family GH31 glycosyl hydrolase)
VIIFDSGLLRVAVHDDPWAVSFGVLEQAAPIAFDVEPRWRGTPSRDGDGDPAAPGRHHATRAADHGHNGDGYWAQLETDDPEGRSARVEIRLHDEATVAVSIKVDGGAVVGQSFRAEPGERFLGFGERSHLFSLDRGVVENYVGEGPYQAHEYPFLSDTIPPWGIRNRPDATYFPMPWVLSSRGFGLLIDRDELSYERFRTEAEEQWSVEVESDSLQYRYFAGPTSLDALRHFTAATGRQPEPSRWFFGPWYQSGHSNHVPLEKEKRQVELLRGSPASVVETHCRYLPRGEDRGHTEEERARTEFFHSQGLAVLSYLNPLVSCDYHEAFDVAAAATALQKDDAGLPYVFQAYVGGRVPPHTDEAQYDFSNRQAVRRWGQVAARLVSAGYDGWMEDFGEYTPLDAYAADGATGSALHNRYPTEYHAAAAEVAADLEVRQQRTLARFVRSGWTGTAPVAPIVWGGDPTTSWGFDGLASALVEGLSMGASGVAMWGSDTGGFMSTEDRLTPDLLRRWIQFSAFCPVMRTKAGGIEIPPYERPQIWDEEVLPSWRRWARWHTRLNDYLLAAHASYRSSGRPIMCALELAYPDMHPVTDQYLLGEDLLVAPVLSPDCKLRRIVFPPGGWIDLFDPLASYEGPETVEVGVGPDDIPVFVRAGAVLSLLPDDVDSLSPYAAPLPDRRHVLAFPRADWAGALGPDAAGRSVVSGDSWTLELSADRPYTWDLSAWLPEPPGTIDSDAAWTLEGGVLTCSLSGSKTVFSTTGTA